MNRIFPIRMIFAAVMAAALLLSAVSDVRKRVIPAVLSRFLLLAAACLLVYEKAYLRAGYFILAVLATGSRNLKIPLFTGAILILANKGESSLPFLFSLAAADLLFSFGIIGGGDAQLLFSMLAFDGQNWLMSVVVAAVTVAAGLFFLICRYGFVKAGKRLISAAGTLGSGNADSGSGMLRIPYACILFISFVLYLFVSLRK